MGNPVSGIWEFFVVESKILGFRIRKTAQGIRKHTNWIGIRFSSSTEKETGIHYMESGVSNVEFHSIISQAELRLKTNS